VEVYPQSISTTRSLEFWALQGWTAPGTAAGNRPGVRESTRGPGRGRVLPARRGLPGPRAAPCSPRAPAPATHTRADAAPAAREASSRDTGRAGESGAAPRRPLPWEKQPLARRSCVPAGLETSTRGHRGCLPVPVRPGLPPLTGVGPVVPPTQGSWGGNSGRSARGAVSPPLLPAAFVSPSQNAPGRSGVGPWPMGARSSGRRTRPASLAAPCPVCQSLSSGVGSGELTCSLLLLTKRQRG